MDGISGLIRGVELTPANIEDTDVADALIMGERRKRLRERGINDRIMHRSHKNQAELPYWQRKRNALVSKVRAPVEGVFGTLKRSYGYWRTRYVGLEKNVAEAMSR